MNYAGVFPDIQADVDEINHNLEVWALYDKEGLGDCSGDAKEGISVIDGFSENNYTREALASGKAKFDYIGEISGDDKSFIFHMGKYYGIMVNSFNNLIGARTIFTWVYNTLHCGTKELKEYGGDSGGFQAWIGGNDIINTNLLGVCNDRLYARIWWRTRQGEWALIPNKECKYSNNGNTTLTGTTRKVGTGKDFENGEWKVISECIGNPYFAFYKEIRCSELNKLGPDFQHSRFNNKYNISLTLNWGLKIDTPPIEIKESCLTLLKFTAKENSSENNIEQTHIITLESNEQFQDAVNSIVEGGGELSNIDIIHGLSTDSNKQPLLPGRIYDYVEGKGLVLRVGKNIVVDDNYIESGRRGLLYNGSNRDSSGVPRYDEAIYNEGINTIIDYDSLVTVQNVK